ncbi:hypothetical protein AB0M02_17200 [Actinoplanes sp. NPDC051861]|uniref:hypothetical protein n=1 Tax=Actinoplanes sp. NPDC051861 TaxID=3155170 RepID=UPI00342A935C
MSSVDLGPGADPVGGASRRYRVLALPPGLRHGTVDAVDPSGRWQAGHAQDRDGVEHLVLWDDGVPADLGTVYLDPVAINRDGMMVGGFSWRYHRGEFRTLAPVPGGHSTVAAVNDGGVAAGSSSRTGARLDVPVLWEGANGPAVLPLGPDDNWGSVAGISGDGTVAGEAGHGAHNVADLSSRPVVWHPSGRIADLALPADTSPGATLRLLGIHDGVITANQKTGRRERVLQWPHPAGVPVVVAEGHAAAVSGTGAIVVYLKHSGGDRSAWLLHGESLIRLRDSTDPLRPAIVTGVTDTGDAYGWAHDDNRGTSTMPVVWRRDS